MEPRSGRAKRRRRGRRRTDPLSGSGWAAAFSGQDSRQSLDHFQWDNPTLKINWALDRPLPWRSPGAVGAGTVHFGVDLDGFVDFAADLSVGRRRSIHSCCSAR